MKKSLNEKEPKYQNPKAQSRQKRNSPWQKKNLGEYELVETKRKTYFPEMGMTQCQWVKGGLINAPRIWQPEHSIVRQRERGNLKHMEREPIHAKFIIISRLFILIHTFSKWKFSPVKSRHDNAMNTLLIYAFYILLYVNVHLAKYFEFLYLLGKACRII